MRCLFLYGAWLSHSAYDAKMVNIAEGIVNHDMHDMPDPRYVVIKAVLERLVERRIVSDLTVLLQIGTTLI